MNIFIYINKGWSALAWAESKGPFQEVVLHEGENQIGGKKRVVECSNNSRVRALL